MDTEQEQDAASSALDNLALGTGKMAYAEVTILGAGFVIVGVGVLATAPVTVPAVIVGVATVTLGVGIVGIGIDLFEGGGTDKTEEVIDKAIEGLKTLVPKHR